MTSFHRSRVVCLSHLNPVVRRALRTRVGLQFCTMHPRASSTSSRMKLLDSPDLCSSTQAVLSSSLSIAFFRWANMWPNVDIATRATTDRRFFTCRQHSERELIMILYKTFKSQFLILLNFVVDTCVYMLKLIGRAKCMTRYLLYDQPGDVMNFSH